MEVIPGVAALNAAASLVGAPLMHDFAAISLSDHLTPWEVIEKRIAAAASADFVLAVYNPRSKTRPPFPRKSPENPPGAPVTRTHPWPLSGRPRGQVEWTCLTTLANIPLEEVDMQSILLVGNSQTYLWKGWMITPRGYLEKYSVSHTG